MGGPSFRALRRILQGDGAVAKGYIGEERLQPVVVLLKDWIVLMVVAACAGKRHPEKGGAGDTRNVIERSWRRITRPAAFVSSVQFRLNPMATSASESPGKEP